MEGFKKFLMQGNVVDLAVAVVIGGAFAAIVDAFVNTIIMPLIAMIGGFDDIEQFAFGGFQIGVLIAAIIRFILIAAVVYFALVLPMTKAREAAARRRGETIEEPQSTDDILKDIRALLEQRPLGGTTPQQPLH